MGNTNKPQVPSVTTLTQEVTNTFRELGPTGSKNPNNVGPDLGKTFNDNIGYLAKNAAETTKSIAKAPSIAYDITKKGINAIGQEANDIHQQLKRTYDDIPWELYVPTKGSPIEEIVEPPETGPIQIQPIIPDIPTPDTPTYQQNPYGMFWTGYTRHKKKHHKRRRKHYFY